MGAYASRLPLDKLDCRKLAACRGRWQRSEGENLGEDTEDKKSVDHEDNIPLMGLSSDADDGDHSHNPDAWTPMNMTGIAMGETAPTNVATTTKGNKEPGTKSAQKEKISPDNDTLFSDIAFGNDANFQNLDSDGFHMGGQGNKKNSMANAEASETTTSDMEREAKAKSGKSATKSKTKKGGRGGDKPKSGGKPGSNRAIKKGGGNAAGGTAGSKPKKRKAKPASAS